MRNGQFAQITHDDTFVQSLIDEGRITEDEAATHPQRSLLLKALTGHEVEPNLTIREARAGDRYLLCSDGLSGVVTHETLADTIQIPDAQACADRMIELALKGGGPDNVTVIVADVVDIDFGEDAPIVGGAAGNGQDDQPPPDSPAVAGAWRITAPRIEPVRAEPTEPPPDPKAKRRKRIRLFVLLALVLLVLAGGAVATWIVVQQAVLRRRGRRRRDRDLPGRAGQHLRHLAEHRGAGLVRPAGADLRPVLRQRPAPARPGRGALGHGELRQHPRRPPVHPGPAHQVPAADV